VPQPIDTSATVAVPATPVKPNNNQRPRPAANTRPVPSLPTSPASPLPSPPVTSTPTPRPATSGHDIF
jgi:hypothetical protein